MLGHLCREFAPSARILVLQLDPRRAEGVALCAFGHSDTIEHQGGVFSLLLKLRAPAFLRPVAASPNDQRAHAIAIAHAEMQGRESAHRDTDHVRLVDSETIENR